MPYQINKHPKYYKYKVCKKPGAETMSKPKGKRAKTARKGKGTGKGKKSGGRNTKKVFTWRPGKQCFSKKWLTKKRAQKQRTAIILRELGIGRK
jgi:hypothetical protein